jgi:putative oxidoreductase
VRVKIGLFAAALSRLDEWSFAMLRIAAGALLVPYGAQKLFGWFGGNRAVMVNEFHRMGLEPAALYLGATGVIEFFGGILVAVGLLTRAAALICAGMLAVTILVTSHGGWTAAVLPVLWTVTCIAIVVHGGGMLSIDRLLERIGSAPEGDGSTPRTPVL